MLVFLKFPCIIGIYRVIDTEVAAPCKCRHVSQATLVVKTTDTNHSQEVLRGPFENQIFEQALPLLPQSADQ